MKGKNVLKVGLSCLTLIYFLGAWGYSIYGIFNPTKWDPNKLYKQKEAQELRREEHEKLTARLFEVADVDRNGFDILNKIEAWKRMDYNCLNNAGDISFPIPSNKQLKTAIASYENH